MSNFLRSEKARKIAFTLGMIELATELALLGFAARNTVRKFREAKANA